jgi:hypothetical protein
MIPHVLVGFSVKDPMSGFDGWARADSDRFPFNSSRNDVFEFIDDVLIPDQSGTSI